MTKTYVKMAKLIVLSAGALLAGGNRLDAQGTAFGYEGRLTEDGRPADGTYDFRFTLHDAITGGSALGGTMSVDDVSVRDGRFVVALNFGGDVFTGASRWLEMSVRTNDPTASFTTLTPRQPVLPAPYAMHARSAGTMDAANLTGTLAEARLPANVARLDDDQIFRGENTFNSPDNYFRGIFAGNGADLTGLDGANLAPGSVGPEQLADGSVVATKLSAGVRNGTFWNLNGNAGTSPGLHFLGTTDRQPLELRVDGRRGLRLEDGGGTVNVIGGSQENAVGAGVGGATIGGGSANRILAYSGTIGGGSANTNAALGATIGGGQANGIGLNSYQATLGGGWQNQIGANSFRATVGGGWRNIVEANASFTTVAGGYGNTIQFGAADSSIGGGRDNIHETNATGAVIGGGRRNLVGIDTYGGTVSGGESNTVRANLATIGGGLINEIRTNAYLATIGGGYANIVEAESGNATIGGGLQNTVRLGASGATISGGRRNTIQSNSTYAAIGGGNENSIGTGSYSGVIAGGWRNEIGTNSWDSTIGGGSRNTNYPNSTHATIPGGAGNAATNYAFAAGVGAKANHTGSFVWADASGGAFASTAFNQFRVRATGGMEVVGGANDPALAYRGTRVGDRTTPVGLAENLNTTGQSAPALRVRNLGGDSLDGALAVSSEGSGAIATFANDAGVVSRLGTDGIWTANGFLGRFSGRFFGDATGLTNVKAGDLVGTIPAEALTSVPAASLTGSIADDRLSANIPRLDADQSWHGANVFHRNLAINDRDLFLRGLGDANHGLGWHGLGKLFAGFAPDGPVLYGWAGGMLGTRAGGERPALAWNSAGAVFVDPADANDGAILGAPGLVFGAENSGEGIASKRTEGGNRWGLDFYTAYVNRMTIANDGRVGIGTLTPTARLDVNGTVKATAFVGDGSGLTGLTMANIGEGAVWKLNGNAGTTAGTHFLGTTDFQPLEIKVNNQRALRLQSTGIGINWIAGAAENFVGASATGATIGGGGSAAYGFTNSVSGTFGTVSGGAHNAILKDAHFGTIGGGRGNAIHTNAESATIAGGRENAIQTNAMRSTIGGGQQNLIRHNSGHATIAGGMFNKIETSATGATIGGGTSNDIQTNAAYATIPGGSQNSAASHAFAAGYRAKANHPGSFVWADATEADFPSTAPNQFRVRASGGMEVVGGLRAGPGGTLQSRVQFGTAAVGTGVGGVNTFNIMFPVAFSTPPKVLVTARGNDTSDVFAISSRAVTAVGFKVNIVRVDLAGGWGQNLQVDWYAVE